MNIKVKTALRAILIGATVLPLIVVALVAMMNIFSFSAKMKGDEASTIGSAQSAGVSNIVSGYINTAKALAGMDVTRNAITDPNSVRDDLKALSDQFTSTGKVLGIAVMNKDGSVIYDSKDSGDIKTFFAYDKNWESKKGAFATKLCRSEATYGDDVFAVIAPLTDAADDAGGYFAIVVSMSEITDYLRDNSFMDSGKLVIADKDTVINFSDKPDSTDALDAELGNSLSSILDTDSASKDDSESKALPGGIYLGTYGKITGTDWSWISLYPAADATNSVMFVFIVAAAVIFALALICVLVMIIATQKVINPMLDMLSTMKNINSGNHSERIDTAGMGKEFSHMALVFNEMMDQAMLSEELHKTVTDLSDNMLFEWDFAKESMYVSENFKENIGTPASGATLNNGKFIDSTMNEDDAEKYKRDMNTLFKNKSDAGGEYQIKNSQGQTIWVSMRAHCITDRLGEVLRVVGVLTDITSEKNATLKLAERASFDFLSQLYNRNTFEREFEAELERSAGKKVAALFIDVDDFKFINDRYSHAVGDEVIRFVADTIKARAGETGFAGRFGGDEFVLCISDPAQVENVEVLSMDIIDDLYSGYYSKSVDATLNIKASIGIAIYPDHSTDSKQLVGCADAAMYFVKKNGKANYHIFEPADNELEGNHSYSL